MSLALAKGLFTTELPRGAHRLLPFFYSCNFRTPTDEPGLLLTGITTFPSLMAHFRYHIDRLLFLHPQLLLISSLIFTEKLFEYVVYSFPFLSPHFTLSYSNPSSPTETTPHTFTKDCEVTKRNVEFLVSGPTIAATFTTQYSHTFTTW